MTKDELQLADDIYAKSGEAHVRCMGDDYEITNKL